MTIQNSLLPTVSGRLQLSVGWMQDAGLAGAWTPRGQLAEPSTIKRVDNVSDACCRFWRSSRYKVTARVRIFDRRLRTDYRLRKVA